MLDTGSLIVHHSLAFWWHGCFRTIVLILEKVVPFVCVTASMLLWSEKYYWKRQNFKWSLNSMFHQIIGQSFFWCTLIASMILLYLLTSSKNYFDWTRYIKLVVTSSAISKIEKLPGIPWCMYGLFYQLSLISCY